MSWQMVRWECAKVSGGGTLPISNLQLLCSPCNKFKGTKTQEQLFGYINRQRLDKTKKSSITNKQK